MKRTLIEILCGVAVVVVMVSFNHQIDRLKVQNRSVDELRQMVSEVSAQAASQGNVTRLHDALKDRLDGRLQQLEHELAQAREGSAEARRLKAELEQSRLEAEQLKLELTQNVDHTKSLVAAYMKEMRAKEESASARIESTNDALRTLEGSLRRDPQTLTRDMLLPTVQLNGDDTVGSGTLIYSRENPQSRKVENYVLTSHHVVRNILADTPRARREGFDVTIYLTDGKRLDVKGRMISHNAMIDAALVQLETERAFPHTAALLPLAESDEVEVWDPVYAVGCPLGNDPVPSAGDLSSKKNTLGGANYWMINAPTYFGNSGGGVYLADCHRLIGVFSKIYTHGQGNPVVVPHMGLCTPITAIYEWLGEEKYDWILDAAAAPAAPETVDPTMLASPGK